MGARQILRNNGSTRGHQRGNPPPTTPILLFIGDCVAHTDLRGGAKHRGNTAVLCLGQVDRVLNGFRVDRVSADVVDDFYSGVDPRMLSSPLSSHFNVVAGNSLSFLFENRNDIRAGTSP